MQERKTKYQIPNQSVFRKPPRKSKKEKENKIARKGINNPTNGPGIYLKVLFYEVL